ncbi:FecR family protein [Emticicia agri]|uniref:FecR family protein n=1 Tax=Emticicia agri TaxID=2492393 RepID=A0A4Q5M3Z1_9BACT|nr:FecR family protein [Emticicia agri]RYU97044.1 FecR family protein [Emticicia agri]
MKRQETRHYLMKSRKAFGKLLQKYLEGKCSESEKHLVEQWYELIDEEPRQNYTEREWEALEYKLWQKIEEESLKTDDIFTETSSTFGFWRSYRVGIAASVTVLLSFGTYWYLHQKQSNQPAIVSAQQPKNELTVMDNTSSKPVRINLEDGSTVTLSPHSQLQYPNHFAANKREVQLTGEALFEVSKNPEKPFYVMTDKLVTRVLGTSFYVRTVEATKKVEVEVLTGKVSVYEKEKVNNQNRGVILTPNHKVTFFTAEKHFITGLVDKPLPQIKPITSKPETFKFDDLPIGEVLSKLERVYGIAIELENDKLSTCPITADITQQPLYTKLDIICATINGKYEIKGTTILISGKGCE